MIPVGCEYLSGFLASCLRLPFPLPRLSEGPEPYFRSAKRSWFPSTGSLRCGPPTERASSPRTVEATETPQNTSFMWTDLPPGQDCNFLILSNASLLHFSF